eukprot:PLAT7067.3.p1 GENE.PLAT7067.3~~PLAT7067.3.p1  ORF type:complete len:479 (-),score=102.18 PLAT7067.3:117-1553(-)
MSRPADAAEMASGGEESKVEVAVCTAGSGAEADADHVVSRIPDDIWSIVLTFCGARDSMSLSSASSWLNNAVTHSIRSLSFRSQPSAFPGSRFASLRSVVVRNKMDLSVVLPALLACPQLRELTLHLRHADAMEAALTNLPLFPRLQTVRLVQATVDGRLGRALASCASLEHVWLLMWELKPSEDADMCNFLHQLSALPTLRSISGVRLRSEDSSTQLCAAIAEWSDLEELSVLSHAKSDGEEAALGSVAAAVCHCAGLRKLSLITREDSAFVMPPKDVQAIGHATELCELALSGPLSAASLSALRVLTKLQQLTLTRLVLDDDGGEEMAALVAEQPLHTLSLSGQHFPPKATSTILHSIATHSSLLDVKLSTLSLILAADDREMVGAALAEAVTRSPVRKLSYHMPFSFMALLRAWDGRPAAAALTALNLCMSESHACKKEEDAALLLRCVRSCAASAVVTLTNFAGSVDAVVASQG